MTAPRIAVFGCGPAGLIAAQTAATMGALVAVFSKPTPSYIAGAQYLHVPVPGVVGSQPDGFIQVDKRGTREGYAEKVYGNPDAPVSWDRYVPTAYPAWSMRTLYGALWRRWSDAVVPSRLTPAIAAQAASEGKLRPDGGDVRVGHYAVDAVVSTVPLSALCQKKGLGHEFIDQTVHIKQEQGLVPDHPSEAKNFIVYNGEDAPGWYRMSHIFGYTAMEWSRRKPPIDDVVTISKPLATNCDCYHATDIPFILAGRYGAWKKDSLVHDVVPIVHSLMERLS